MWIIDDWLDLIRLGAFLVSLYCVVMLLIRYKKHGKSYNAKTKDIWFAFEAWSVAGCVAMAQGAVLNRPFTPGFVVIVAAILVSGKAIHARGQWGGNVA